MSEIIALREKDREEVSEINDYRRRLEKKRVKSLHYRRRLEKK